MHCAVLPLALALLPALSIGFLADHRFELAFVAAATVFGLSSLVIGFRRHGRFRALSLLVPGLALVLFGSLVEFAHQNVLLHAVLMSIGGTLIGVAHLANARLSHGHVHDACCSHSSG